MALRRNAVFVGILHLIYERGLAIRLGDADLELDELDNLVSEGQGEQELSQEEAGLLKRWNAEVLMEADDQHESLDHEHQEFNPKKAFQKLLTKGVQKESAMTCQEIQKNMPEVVRSATELIQPLCAGEEGCDFAALDIDQVVSAQSRFVALASAADKKKCLPEAMEGVAFEQLLEIIPSLLGDSEETETETDGDSEEGDPKSQQRMKDAYSQMLSFQQGFVSLADVTADRTLLHSMDSCPCDKCKPLSGFSFQCYLTKQNKDKEMPRGVDCGDPKKRWGWGSLLLRRKYRTRCTVADWDQAVLQQLHLSSVMSCASLDMVVGLRNEITSEFRTELFENCMDHEQKESDWNPAIKEKCGKSEPDGAVSKQNRVVIGVVLTFGQVSAMADLRSASRGNYLAPSVLMQREMVTQAFAAAGEKVGLDGQDGAILYGDRSLKGGDRAKVLHRLKTDWVATIQASGPVAQGTMSLMLFALESSGKAPQGEVQASNVTGITKGQVLKVVAIVASIFVLGVAATAVLAHFAAIAIMGAFFAGVTGFAGTLLYIVLFMATGGLIGSAIISLVTMFVKAKAKAMLQAKIRDTLCPYFSFFGRCLLPKLIVGKDGIA